MSFIREFELQAYEKRKNNAFKTLIYLCLGQESIYASVNLALPGFQFLVNIEGMVYILPTVVTQKNLLTS